MWSRLSLRLWHNDAGDERPYLELSREDVVAWLFGEKQ
jgi:hypothetical protein